MSDNKSSSGLVFITVLFLIFLFLKLGGFGVVANWSWWWVTSPLWVPFVIGAIILFVVLLLDSL